MSCISCKGFKRMREREDKTNNKKNEKKFLCHHFFNVFFFPNFESITQSLRSVFSSFNSIQIQTSNTKMQTPTTDIFERLRNGEIIPPNDPQAYRMLEACYDTKKLLMKMNNSTDPVEIRDLLGQITNSKIDESTALFTPLYINYGKHTKIGKNVFINFDCTFLDLGGITIEDNVLIAPKVSLLTEGHPISPENRHALIPKPIHIKKNAWICAGATILQGVTIGENSIVAAGAVVSKDVPDNMIVGGIPAKIIKAVTNE